MDVGKDTALCDSDVTQELVQLLVVSDGELQVTWNDTGLLVVTRGIAGKFENLSREVFKDSCEVHWSTSTDTLGVVAFPQETVDTTDWECETGLGRATEWVC